MNWLPLPTINPETICVEKPDITDKMSGFLLIPYSFGLANRAGCLLAAIDT
ncbi:hypothetical protein [Spirosoma terrae]|uniref:Uncharacterized protein n=1 Tax=Spirosoma terrae TaxID=1968276 RepID=A0A6L9L9V8_9BACT|nr:hypothetical protein [Spirosoma terrae]NDU95583.1 hypothetical protein [Spirosoma terrae]